MTNIECTVVNKYKESFDVYIGRGSKWGNPFSHKTDTLAQFKVDTREDSIDEYKKYIYEGEGQKLLLDLHELKGKRLGCYCKPNSCHGDFLAELTNTLYNNEFIIFLYSECDCNSAFDLNKAISINDKLLLHLRLSEKVIFDFSHLKQITPKFIEVMLLNVREEFTTEFLNSHVKFENTNKLCRYFLRDILFKLKNNSNE